MNNIKWNILTSIDQLEDFDQLSKGSPILLFKHSTSCSISAAAINRLERKWNQDKHPDVKPYYLDLIANRDVSNAISLKYGVEHQSPQVLIISDNNCVYDNSHFGISYDEIVEEIASIN